MKKFSFFLLSIILASPFISGETVVYKVDPVHSGVSFKVRHFLNKVPGNFTQFEGEIHYNKENPEKSKAVGQVQVKSVDTRNTDRDEHLQNEDFFNSSQNPLIEFASTSWTPIGENTYKVKGTLKMAGHEKPIELELLFLGEMEGRGTIRSGWEGKTTINRSDWGIEYGAPAVGKEVEIELNLQAHRQ